MLKINCKVIASMKVSNFNELWFAIQNNGKILTFWRCNNIIPSLYEKEYKNKHEYTTPSALLLLVLGIKAQKKK